MPAEDILTRVPPIACLSPRCAPPALQTRPRCFDDGFDNAGVHVAAASATLRQCPSMAVLPMLSCTYTHGGVYNDAARECRGRFEVLLCKDRLALRSAKALLEVPYKDIDVVYILDGMPAERKGRVVLLAHLRAGTALQHGKQQLQSVVLEAKEADTLDVASVPAANGAVTRVAVRFADPRMLPFDCLFTAAACCDCARHACRYTCARETHCILWEPGAERADVQWQMCEGGRAMR